MTPQERIASALWAINHKEVSDEVAEFLDGIMSDEDVEELERIVDPSCRIEARNG